MARENEVEIQLGGRKRILKYNTRAIKVFERISGKAALAVINKASEAAQKGDNASVLDALSITFLSLIIFAGLAHYDDKAITEESVDTWLDGYSGDENLIELTNKLMQAVIAGYPSLKAKTAKDKARLQEAPLA